MLCVQSKSALVSILWQSRISCREGGEFCFKKKRSDSYRYLAQ